MVPIAAWSVILQDWFLVAFSVYGETDISITATRYYTVGWPGSRLDPYRRFLSIRISDAQWLLAGLVFLIATLPPLLMHDHVQKEVIVAVTGLVSAVWLFRFVRTMRTEGWRGKKDGAPPARP
jgi:hypothetical protein